jgi:hypothetical protein
VDEHICWPVAQFCETCQTSPTGLLVKSDWCPVPGSLLVEEGWGVIDTALLNALPDSLVTREFNLHLRAYST